MSETSTTPVTISYARLPSQGIVYGLSGWGFTTVLVAVFIAVIAVLRGGFLSLLASLPVAVPVAMSGVFMIHGEPVIRHVLREVGGLMRHMVGATKYKRRPEKSRTLPESALDIPGRPGRLHLFETGTGAVVVWDARAQTATVVCMVATPGMGVPQPDAPSTVTGPEREALVYEWARVLGGFTQKPHMVRVTQLEHTRPGSVAAETRAFEEQLASFPPEVAGSPVFASYRETLALASRSVVSHVTQLALTFTLTGEAKALMKGAGGKRAGMLHIAELEMAAASDALFHAGFQRVAWMSPREWGAWGRQLIDPVAQPMIDARIGTVTQGADPWASTPMLIDERRTWVETDTAFHRTYWIYQWPRYETHPGFLSSLVLAKPQTGGVVRHTLALVGSPTPVGKAMKQLEDDKRTWITNENLRAKTGKPTSEADNADWRAIQQHEADLVAGQGELQMSAYLTVTALDKDRLEQECAAVLNACSRAGLEPRMMPWQQAEALMNVVYPSGTGMK